MQYDDGTSADVWTDVIGLAPASTASEVIVSSGVIPGTLYAFRVRAMNIFGWGPYSLVTYIQAAHQPAAPLAPTTSIEAATGGVAIAWIAPDASGDPITAFKIEILNKAGNTWFTDSSCDGAIALTVTALRCVVPMSDLTAAPFNYVFQDVVIVRVSAANSYPGFGPVSPSSDALTGAAIRVVPVQMAAPTKDSSSTDATVTMDWVALSGTDAGNSAVIAYSLYWDGGDAGLDPATSFIPLVDDLVQTFTVNSVTGGMTYRFVVTSRNIYGYGPNSAVTTLQPHDAPGKTDIPTVALDVLDLTQVKISWNAPNDHSAPILHYQILFMKVNGQFVPELTSCDGSLTGLTPLVSGARTCSVPMTTLRTLTALPRDSLIRVKV